MAISLAPYFDLILCSFELCKIHLNHCLPFYSHLFIYQERNSAVVVLLPDEAGWRSKDVRVFADEISFFNQVYLASYLCYSAIDKGEVVVLVSVTYILLLDLPVRFTYEIYL
jgi:hypothetical protein